MREKKKKMYLLAILTLLISTSSFGEVYNKAGEYETSKNEDKKNTGAVHQITAVNKKETLVKLTNKHNIKLNRNYSAI